MAIAFTVTNDDSISQLRLHSEIRGNIGPGFIRVDTNVTVSPAVAAEYYRRTVLPLTTAERGKIGKQRFLDALKSYVRETGIADLERGAESESLLPDDIRTDIESAKLVGALVGTSALTVPVIAFCLNARSVAAVIEREYITAETANAPLPTYTLPGLKLAIRAAITAIGRSGIAAITPRDTATLAAFNAIPLLFSGPPAGTEIVKPETESAAANPAVETSAAALESAAVESTTTTGGTELQTVTANVVGNNDVTTESVPAPALDPARANRSARRQSAARKRFR